MDDERFYEQVLSELQHSPPRPGLWLKAMHLADGNEQRARMVYVGLRVKQLKLQTTTDSVAVGARKVLRGVRAFYRVAAIRPDVALDTMTTLLKLSMLLVSVGLVIIGLTLSITTIFVIGLVLFGYFLVGTFIIEGRQRGNVVPGAQVDRINPPRPSSRDPKGPV
jgi:hypothetical protein